MHCCAYWGENSHKLIENLTLENQNFYTAIYWIFVVNLENMKIFVWLLMHVIMLFISILTDFVTYKIAFYSKLYDIYLLDIVTHDRTYITLYVHELLLSLYQHCFGAKKAPRGSIQLLPTFRHTRRNHTVLEPLQTHGLEPAFPINYVHFTFYDPGTILVDNFSEFCFSLHSERKMKISLNT